MFFRKGKIPIWENFTQGGNWILQRGKRMKDLKKIEMEWERLLFACIGE